ncbi:uncharacterized protein LOC125132382 isoform X2 [Phacochoerus africanus]|uniref:uncharacterized protein LOC125132382 isoform X2 n=1 Tax=Phacochoerus africanus TaxID=41426 RepID=UPI001FD9DA6F|nr:uncharacterized protein LOC125132382 isoform X2 [Phacochoerus africanus]
MGFGNGFGDSFACVTLSSSCSVNTWPRTEPSSPFSPACGYAASTPKVRPVRRGLTATVPSSQCRRKYRWTWGFTVLTVQVPIVCSSAPAPCPAPCWWRPRGTRPALTNQLPPPSAPRCHEDRHPMSLPRAMCHSQRNASPGVTASDRSVCIRVCRALCSPPMRPNERSQSEKAAHYMIQLHNILLEKAKLSRKISGGWGFTGREE